MKTVLLAITVLLFSFPVIAQEGQNLVENGSFEMAKGRKITRVGDIERADGWVSPTGETADLFSAEAKQPNLKTPENIYGTEEPKAGINYAGIVAYSYRGKRNRTYLTRKLKDRLKKGMHYKVKFYISLAELSKYASNRVGIHFSKRIPGTNQKVPAMILKTDIEHPEKKLVDGMFGWSLICGEYVATGREEFITIGNFSNPNEIQYDRVRKPRDIRGQQIVAAYYYVDDISVRLLGPNEKCDCKYADKAVQTTGTVYKRAPSITDKMTLAEEVAEYHIFYVKGRYILRVNGENTLTKIAEILKNNPSMKIQVTGHMDNKESANAAYQDISQKRAKHIKTLLEEKGISMNRILTRDAKAADPSQYINEGDKEELKAAKNRRVSFKVL